jgi:hypothetical protein
MYSVRPGKEQDRALRGPRPARPHPQAGAVLACHPPGARAVRTLGDLGQVGRRFGRGHGGGCQHQDSAEPEFHRRAHVAVELELAGHEGRRSGSGRPTGSPGTCRRRPSWSRPHRPHRWPRARPRRPRSRRPSPSITNLAEPSKPSPSFCEMAPTAASITLVMSVSPFAVHPVRGGTGACHGVLIWALIWIARPECYTPHHANSHAPSQSCRRGSLVRDSRHCRRPTHGSTSCWTGWRSRICATGTWWSSSSTRPGRGPARPRPITCCAGGARRWRPMTSRRPMIT